MFRKKKEAEVAAQNQMPPSQPTWEQELLQRLRTERTDHVLYIEECERKISNYAAHISELDRRIATVNQLMKIRQVAATLKPLFKQAAAAVENL